MTLIRAAVALVALVVLVQGLPKCRFQKDGDYCGCLAQGLGCASARPSLSNFSESEIRSLYGNLTLDMLEERNQLDIIVSEYRRDVSYFASRKQVESQPGRQLPLPQCAIRNMASGPTVLYSPVWWTIPGLDSSGNSRSLTLAWPNDTMMYSFKSDQAFTAPLKQTGFCNPVLSGATSSPTVTIPLQCCDSSFCSSCGLSQLGTVGTCFSCVNGHTAAASGVPCEEPTDCKPVVAPGCAANHIGVSLAGSVVCAELDGPLALDGRVAIVAWRGASAAVAAKVNFTNWLGAFDVPVLEQNSNGDGIIWALTLRRFVDRGGGVADPDRQDHIVVTAEEGCTSEISFFTLIPVGSTQKNTVTFQSSVPTVFSETASPATTALPSTTNNRDDPPQVEYVYVQDHSVRDGLLAFGIIVALAVLALFVIGFVRWWRKRKIAEVPAEVRSRLEANANFRREAAEAQEMQTTRNSNRSEAEVA
jgi:hypothetical protein